MIPYVGQLLDDRYEILEVLGTGGMAVVYKAMCHRLNRLVAIKVLKEEYSGDSEFRRRFRAEGEAVAMLGHPNIVQVYDVSASDDANYIVMELVEGLSLKQYMDTKGVLNWKETLHFATQIAKGLEHAHGRGIVHRDIKPHNVMVLKNGSVKVMDFGIAQVMNRRSTLTKEALGSVHYISPEQARGSYTDNRSDIYSLGVVMYEMMTGRPPYDAENSVTVAIMHINGGAPLPSTLNPNIPRGMEQIIMRAMALDPRDRFISATEMLQDLEEFRKDPARVFGYKLTAEDSTRKLPALSLRPPRSIAEQKAQKQKGTATDTAAGRKINTGRIEEDVKEYPPRRDPEAVRKARERRREEERRRAERTRTVTVAVISCSVVAMVAIVVLLVAIFNGALVNSRTVKVPYLVGEVYSEDFAGMYSDLHIRLKAQQYDDYYEQGKIMLQEPAGGTEVKKDADLYITISMGPEPTVKQMEDLGGVTQDRAVSFLVGQGLKFLIREEANDEYPAGYVIRTDPEAGTDLSDGQTVKLWISTGPDSQMVKMPYLLEVTGDQAVKLLDSLGFRNVSMTSVYSSRPKGMVVSQSIPATSIIAVSTHIILEISDGPETDTEVMPDVLALDEDAAIHLLGQMGFTNVQTYPVKSDRIRGQVVAQSVSADTRIDLNKEILLGVSEGQTGDEDQPDTHFVTFTVPVRQLPYKILICHKGQPGSQVASAEIPVGISTYMVEVSGTGTMEYDLYIDGQYWQTQKVTIQSNG